MQMRVRSLACEAEDILSLELVAPGGDPLPAFTPGAHIDLRLAPGLTRSYSLVNPAHERHRYVVAVSKDPASRGGSRHVHERLRPGDVIEVSAPANHFALVEDAPQVVMFAGGIGITPLWCMAQRLHALGRAWVLHYSVRQRARCAYLQELQALERASPGHVHFHFDEEEGGRPMDLRAVIDTVAPQAHLYCCGPPAMLRAFEQAAAQRAPGTVHVEYFSARAEAAVARSYRVVLARSGRTFEVPAGKTILSVLLQARLDVPYSCGEGVCGACETRVLSGEPDHRDTVLSPQEAAAGRTMMICCSGSRSETLVLDL